MTALTIQQIEQLVADSGCAMRTVAAVLAGRSTQPVSRRRVAAAAARLGIPLVIPEPAPRQVSR